MADIEIILYNHILKLTQKVANRQTEKRHNSVSYGRNK